MLADDILEEFSTTLIAGLLLKGVLIVIAVTALTLLILKGVFKMQMPSFKNRALLALAAFVASLIPTLIYLKSAVIDITPVGFCAVHSRIVYNSFDMFTAATVILSILVPVIYYAFRKKNTAQTTN